MLRTRTALITLLAMVLSSVLLVAQATNIKSSGTLPTTCSVGNIYVKTGASSGFYICLSTNTWTQVGAGGGGSGDVVGPGSATDNAVARFDSTTGKLIQNTSAFTIADDGTVSFPDGIRQTFNPDGTVASVAMSMAKKQ